MIKNFKKIKFEAFRYLYVDKKVMLEENEFLKLDLKIFYKK